ncbi:MAG: 4Fe-4S binding protein [Calditrichaceae bacterium]|nr:4Fe-4S binding protein [Calditrichaceae bacterium]
MAKLRRIVQVLFLLFFILLFIKARYPYDEVKLPSDLGLRFSPLIPLFDFIDSWSLSLRYWPALIILFLTPFLGRFFCGWICPLGTTIDISSKILKSPSNKISKKWQKLRFFKYALLVSFIILAFFSINGWGYFDPLSIFNRALSILLYPLATLLVENGLLALSDIPFLEDAAYGIYDPFKNHIMPEGQAFYQHVFWIGLFFAFILGLEKLSRRFWCRNICPAGALLGFLSQFRFYERIVGPACPVCNKCQVECKMNAIPEDDISLTNKAECIECFSCGEVCPPKYKAISYRWRWKPYHSPVDYNRRQFLKTSAGSAAAVGLLSIGLVNKDENDKMIRPPGSLPEDEFRDRCIRCMECVRICESNGGCLQPDRIHNDITDLWLPVAVMRSGYCEYNCNLCGQVCPTEAILPLVLEDKKKVPMGLAHFDKNVCIPYARNEDCLVCEEHCPTSDKAIKFDIREVVLPDGSVKKVKYPYVVKDLCIGCGICEDKCPLIGKPGIFVNTENQRRLTKTQLA